MSYLKTLGTEFENMTHDRLATVLITLKAQVYLLRSSAWGEEFAS